MIYREKIQRYFPAFYKIVVIFLSPIVHLLQFRTLNLDWKAAYWNLQASQGQKYLNTRWAPENSYENYLKIPLDKISLIKFSEKTEFFQYNPSLRVNGKFFDICWRVSDNVLHPSVNSQGVPKFPLKGYRSGINIGKIRPGLNTKIVRVFCETVLIEAHVKERSPHHVLTDESGRDLEFDDPRYVLDDSNYILLHGRFNPASQDPKLASFVPILYSFKDDRLTKIIYPSAKKYEKNWVPISVTDQKILCIRSTNPFVTVRIDTNKGQAIDYVQGESFGEYIHNGSNIIQLDVNMLIRVVRVRINVPNLKAIHISYIIVHDSNFVQLFKTKPFVFQGYGFEICNSIIEFGSDVYFTWGQNDRNSFIGRINKRKLMSWIYSNRLYD